MTCYLYRVWYTCVFHMLVMLRFVIVSLITSWLVWVFNHLVRMPSLWGDSQCSCGKCTTFKSNDLLSWIVKRANRKVVIGRRSSVSSQRVMKRYEGLERPERFKPRAVTKGFQDDSKWWLIVNVKCCCYNAIMRIIKSCFCVIRFTFWNCGIFRAILLGPASESLQESWKTVIIPQTGRVTWIHIHWHINLQGGPYGNFFPLRKFLPLWCITSYVSRKLRSDFGRIAQKGNILLYGTIFPKSGRLVWRRDSTVLSKGIPSA